MAATDNTKITECTVDEGLAALQGRLNVTSFDPMSVIHNQKPEYYYHWILDKPARVDFVKAIGYEVVNRTNDTARGGRWHDGAAAWKSGDRILMRMRRHLWEQRREVNAKRYAEHDRRLREEFQADADRAGVKVITEK